MTRNGRRTDRMMTTSTANRLRVNHLEVNQSRVNLELKRGRINHLEVNLLPRRPSKETKILQREKVNQKSVVAIGPQSHLRPQPGRIEVIGRVNVSVKRGNRKKSEVKKFQQAGAVPTRKMDL